MITLKNNEYIVFEPDQVLTNDHLNQLFYYLDSQNRLTRTRLIGIGIACGFEIEVTLDSQSLVSMIQINKGCGITSKGYVISDCTDHQYGYVVPYVPPPLPKDLPFSCDAIPFYDGLNNKKECTGIYKLVTCEQYKTIVEDPASPRPAAPPCGPTTALPPNDPRPGTNVDLPVPLTSIYCSQYAVVLFLEAKEKDLKNCDMQDCNNKGEKMLFHIRPLLVPKRCLKNNCEDQKSQKPVEIKLKRFAVQTNNPVNDITNGPNIVKTFQNIFNGTSQNVLQQVSDAYNYCYVTYGTWLPPGSNSFVNLSADLQNIFTFIQGTFLVQYFYDYINDLILAYDEFKNVANKLDIQCCADECAFPLHLVLGDASKSTSRTAIDCWRTYFIRTGEACCDGEEIDKMRFYYHRMEILAGQFSNRNFTVPLTDRKSPIKIIPSEYEKFPLSERVIPYYYSVLDTANTGNGLFQFWNFKKAADDESDYNLGYNANQYSSNVLVTTPLLFDIEKNNFFRIEGHIGLRYSQVLFNILEQRQIYNLPFNVVGVAAERFFPTPIDVESILSCLKVLITDFESLIIDFLCKLLLCTRKLSMVRYEAKPAEQAATAGNTINAEEFLKSFQFGTSSYKTGDFINFFNPPAGTLGKAYIDSIQEGKFTNKININDLQCDNLDLNKSYHAGFNVLHTADNLFETLLNTKPQELDVEELQTQFKKYDTQFSALKTQISAGKSNLFSTGVLEDCCDCLSCLFVDLLWMLKQITDRIKEYESDRLFSNYFKKHPGLEHKSGVPKGGTFVLVYSMANLAPEPVILLTHRELSLNAKASEAAREPVVIADFYIPYLCCNDCTPAVYLSLPVDKSVFSITPDKFLFDDAHNYPFKTSEMVSPSDFDSTTNPGDLNLLTENNTLNLHPAMDIKSTLETTLTYKSITVPITIVVPDASFTVNITRDPNQRVSVELAAKNTDATSYKWIVNSKGNLFENIAQPAPVLFSTLEEAAGSKDLQIELIITYVLNDTTSSDAKVANITSEVIKQHLNVGPFTPEFTNDIDNASEEEEPDAAPKASTENKTKEAGDVSPSDNNAGLKSKKSAKKAFTSKKKNTK